VSSGQYFEDEPTVATKTYQVPLHLSDMSFDLDVARGVFSTRKIDDGTRVLLVEAAQPGQAKTDASVWAVDVNRRARELCASNAERLGLNITTAAPQEVPEDLRFDLIVSNPPIRIGKKNLHALLTLWLDRLTLDGHAELVVQKHLGSDSLHRWLNEQGWATTRLTSRSSYRVLHVTARTPPPAAKEEEE